MTTECTDPKSPPIGTVERFAWDYLHSVSLADKVFPGVAPTIWESDPVSRQVDAPGRPPELVVTTKRTKTPKALHSPARRAELVHVFMHHELQATELMLRALLLFVDVDVAFRQGLFAIALDEIRHLQMYEAYLNTLSHRFGDFPVRDWFWERVPSAATPAAFVATMGIGFEGANLDHTRRFAAMFRAVGDEAGAVLQERIGDEEVAHVEFALRWFRRFVPGGDVHTWRRLLPKPLTPIIMRGLPLDRERRARAGMPPEFADVIEAWTAASEME